MRGSWIAVGVALFQTACVVGAERAPTLAQTRATPARPDTGHSAGDLLVPGPAEPRPEKAPPRPRVVPATGGAAGAASSSDADFVWVQGDWRWDGVRYVWHPGRWEPARPSWIKQAR